ncbi:molybdenum cofactor biosynthesis protein MoaE [Chryseobacterium camelliae]|uniref:molybdenum cofactor biosynthesis protein MoaE n=1 Tax=Chryseobacterium camelliae TaxID=1265445 RepID=UPI0028610064|nr:molybdenum cofactor biosynthesis protein MoaE [Chryseobacterium camelliae]MDR6513640.1 molybdopterin synthase catalytic subunit [Chryseobacterium camelliae]
MKKEITNIFIQGAISPQLISESIAKHSVKKNIGAHSIFLGQIREDVIDNRVVKAIEYTAYEEMALERMRDIREDIFSRYELTCMHVYHSLGTIHAGEICLFVFTSSKHRKMAMDACDELVERIKSELQVWGKEIINDETHQWKVNN